jgi:hypothetical protein
LGERGPSRKLKVMVIFQIPRREAVNEMKLSEEWKKTQGIVALKKSLKEYFKS